VKRRELLIGGAACLLGPGRALGTEPTSRGLWRGRQGAFAIGRFPEFGGGLFGFDYAALEVGSPSLPGRRLSEVRVRRRAFEARSDGAVLSAELADSEGRPARGTIAMIYGSGPAPKEAFDLWAFWFLAAGFAVLTYDKRGSGRSTGDWRSAGLETLASDARAVIDGARALHAPGTVLAWGASQAGWIAPQLGAAGAIDGIILHAGSSMRPGEQILAQVEAELRAYGLAEEEIGRARNYYALDTDVSRGLRPWAAVDLAYRQASARGAEWLLAPPAPAAAPERTMIRLMADFDPGPFWRASRVPILALFGGKDWIVPAEPNRAALRRLVAPEAPLADLVLPRANHLMFDAETGLREEYPSRRRIDHGYFASIASWLERRGL
jgi:pimeloyl-ACP methyl ester carboxylesterase